jgi:nucleoid DNA-binding protein
MRQIYNLTLTATASHRPHYSMASRKKTGVKPLSKAQVMTALAERSDLTKKQVTDVFEHLGELISENLRKHKQFTLPGLLKITVVHKKAKPARPGRNPFTGEKMMFKAKPAHDQVRLRALKRLKDMV